MSLHTFITVMYFNVLRDKTMDNKLTYIPNDDKQSYPFCRLNYWSNSLVTQRRTSFLFLGFYV